MDAKEERGRLHVANVGRRVTIDITILGYVVLITLFILTSHSIIELLLK